MWRLCFREMLREMVDQLSIHQEAGGGPDLSLPTFQRYVPDPPSRMYSRMFRYVCCKVSVNVCMTFSPTPLAGKWWTHNYYCHFQCLFLQPQAGAGRKYFPTDGFCARCLFMLVGLASLLKGVSSESRLENIRAYKLHYRKDVFFK
jgi:hypothetical protein